MNMGKTYLRTSIHKLSKMHMLDQDTQRTNLSLTYVRCYNIGKLSFLKTLKRRIPSVIVMTFMILSFWAFMVPMTVFAADTTGAKYPGTAASTGTTGIHWTNPNNIKSDDGFVAAVTFDSKTTTSTYLKGTKYGFNIPAGAAINEVKVGIKRYGLNIIDSEICLVNKSGTITTINKADTSNEWGSTIRTAYYTWSSTELSNAGLTLDDINSENFGVALKVTSSKTYKNAYVDYMQITVTYTPDTTAPSISSVTGNPTSWQNTNITLTVNATDDLSDIAAKGGYSFDNGSTWQDINQKTFNSNQTVNIKVKDAVGNISATYQVEINKIDKEKPTFTISGSPASSQNTDIKLTVNAADTSSGIAATGGYSFDNGNTWQDGNQKVVGSNLPVNIKVKDAACNISDGAQILSYPDFTSNQANYTVEVRNGSGSGNYKAFSNVTIKASDLKDKVFAGWKDKTPDPVTGAITDSIISYDPTYTFIITGDKLLEATYADSAAPKPEISLGNSVFMMNVNSTYGKMFFTSNIAVPKGYQLIECGVVMSKTISENLTKENALSVLKSTSQNSAGQFYSIFNVTYGNTLNVRSYIKYKNEAGTEVINYSKNTVTATMTRQ